MPELQASRTLVKSAPELWEVCSDPDSLGRHLQAFGEIRITRVEPETTVAWEGERVSGTVRIEPSGWGTRVTLTAIPEAASPDEVAESEPEPEPDVEPGVAEAEAEPEAVAEPEAEPEAVGAEPEADVRPEADAGPETNAGPETAVESESEPQPEPVAAPKRGRLRRFAGKFFKSLVTPVEIPEDAFTGPAGTAPSPASEADLQSESESESAPEPGPEPQPEPALEPEPVLHAEREPEPEPELQAEPEPVAQATTASENEVDPAAVLQSMLNRLGSDHHRPFSRS